MAGLNLRVGINVLQATRELRNLSRSLKGVGKAAQQSNAQMKGLQAGMTSLTATATALGSALLSVTGLLAVFGAGAGAAKALEFAADFEKSLAEVNTLLDDSSVSIEKYEQQLLKLSTTSSKTLEDLTRGLYDVISSGIPAVEGASGAFNVLAVSQRAAVAGLTSTETAVGGVTAVLNSYGRETIFAEEVSDKLFTAVKLGRTRFDDLSKGIGRVAPIAKEAGASLDEILTLFVEITKSGVSPRETITGLRNILKSFIKPTAQTTEFIEEFNKRIADTGKQVDLTSETISQKGLIGALRDISQATGGDAGTLAELFPNIRALLPALITLGNGFSDVETTFAKFADSAGATAAAFEKIDVVFSETIAKLISNLGKLSVEATRDVLKGLNETFSGFNEQFASGSAGEGARKFVNDLVDNFKSFVAFLDTAKSAIIDFGAVFLSLRIGRALGPLSQPGLLTGAITSFNTALNRSRAQTGSYVTGVGALFAKLAGDVTVATTRMIAGTTRVTAETAAAEIANTKFGVALTRTNTAIANSSRANSTLSNAVRALSGIMSTLGAAIAKLNTSLASMIAQNSSATASTRAKTAAVVADTSATSANSLALNANALAGLRVTAALGSEAVAFKNLSFNIGVNQRAAARLTAETAKLSAGASNVTRTLTTMSLETARLSRNLGVGLVGAAKLAQGRMLALQGQFFRTGQAITATNLAATRAQFASVGGTAAAAAGGVAAFGGALSAAAGGPIGLAAVVAFGLFKAIKAAFNSLIETGPAVAEFGDAWSILRTILIGVADALARVLSVLGIVIGAAIVPLTGDTTILNNSLTLLKKGLTGLAEEARKSKEEVAALNKESKELKENADNTAKALGFNDAAGMQKTIDELRVRIDVLEKPVAKSKGTQAKDREAVESGEVLASGNVKAVLGNRFDFSTDDLGGFFAGKRFEDESAIGASLDERNATIEAVENLLRGQDEAGGALGDSLTSSIEEAKPALQSYFDTLTDGSKGSLLTIEEFGSRLEKQLTTKGGLKSLDAKALVTQAQTNILMSKRANIVEKIQDAELAVEKTASIRAAKQREFNRLVSESEDAQLLADEARRRGDLSQERIYSEAAKSRMANADAVFLELEGIEAQSTGLLSQLTLLLKKLDINLDIVDAQDAQLEKQKAAAAKARADIKAAKDKADAAKFQAKIDAANAKLEQLREQALKSSRQSALDLIKADIRRLELEREITDSKLKQNAAERQELEFAQGLNRSAKNLLKVTSEAGRIGLGLNPALREFDAAIEESMKKRERLTNESFRQELTLLQRQTELQAKERGNQSDDRQADFRKRIAQLAKLRQLLGAEATSPVKALITQALKDAQQVFSAQAGIVTEEQGIEQAKLFQSYQAEAAKLNEQQRKFQLERRQLLALELKEITDAIIADQKKRNQGFIKSFQDLERRARFQSNIKVLATAEDVDVDTFLSAFQEKLKGVAPEFGIKVKLKGTDDVNTFLTKLKQGFSGNLPAGIKELENQITNLNKKFEKASKSAEDVELSQIQKEVGDFQKAVTKLQDELRTDRPKLAEQLEEIGSKAIVMTDDLEELSDKLIANKRAQIELAAQAKVLSRGFGGGFRKSVKDLRSEFGKLSFDIGKAFTQGLSKAFKSLEKFLDDSTSLVSSSADLLTDKLRERIRGDDFNIFGGITGGARERAEKEIEGAQETIAFQLAAREKVLAKARQRGLEDEEIAAAQASKSPMDDGGAGQKFVSQLSTKELEVLKISNEVIAQMKDRVSVLEKKLSFGIFSSFTAGAESSTKAIQVLDDEIAKLQRFSGVSEDVENTALFETTPAFIANLAKGREDAIDRLNREIVAKFGNRLTPDILKKLQGDFRLTSRTPTNALTKGAEGQFDPKSIIKDLTAAELKDGSAKGILFQLGALLGDRNVEIGKLGDLRSDADRSARELAVRKSLVKERDELASKEGESISDFEGFKKASGKFFDDALLFAKGQTEFQKENAEAVEGFSFKEFFKGIPSALQETEGVGLEGLLSSFGPIPEAFGKAADKLAATFIRFPVDLLSGDLFTKNFAEGFGGSIADAGIAFGEFFIVALPKAFSLSVDILKEGLLLTFEQFISVLGKTLAPIGEAVAAPVGRLLGSLGSAVGVLADTDAEEDRRDRKNALELQRATLAQLQANGASNESIAQEQARLAALLSTKPRETAAERLEAEIERAVTAAKNIAKDLGPLVAQFFTSVTAALPEVIPKLADGLISALQEFAAGFPEFFETLVTQVVDALPAIIDAIIDLLPGLVLALIRAATAIITRLPDIVTSAINSIVENIPLIIDALVESLPALIASIIKAVPQIIAAILKGIPQIIMAIIVGVPQIIFALIRSIPDFLGAFGRAIGNLVLEPFRGFADAIDKFVGAIGDFVKGTGDALRDAFTFGQGKVEDPTSLKGAAKVAGQTAAAAGTGAAIGGAVAGPAGAIVGTIIGTVGGFISSVFHKGGNVVSGMRNKGLADAYRAAGVQGFLNGGMVGDTLRKNFKASMSDDVPALLQTGEAVLNRSAVANVGGPAAIDAINSGAGIAPNLNVNVGINANGNGLSNAAAALLPFLISSINVTSQSGKSKSSTGQLLGYKGVSAMPSGII